MAPRIVTGSAHARLAEAVAATLGTDLAGCDLERFPDGELRPAVGQVRGDDVYVIQPTGPPVNDHVIELLLLLDACRRAGAGRLTAVVPYFGYARQDRRGRPGDPVGARVVVRAMTEAGADRLVVVDPHTTALEAMSDIPVEVLTAVPVLAAALAPLVADDAVLVAADLGAVKLAERYAARLGLPVAVVRKSRISGRTVAAEDVVGHVEGHPVVIADDMISTGATIEAAAQVLLRHGAAPDILVAATHGLFVGDATGLLAGQPIRGLAVTDTLPGRPTAALALHVASVAPWLGEAIACLHRNEALDDLLVGR